MKKLIKRVLKHYNLVPVKTVTLKTGVVCEHFKNGNINVKNKQIWKVQLVVVQTDGTIQIYVESAESIQISQKKKQKQNNNNNNNNNKYNNYDSILCSIICSSSNRLV